MKMDILNMEQKPWNEIREIYMEAFPKAERKPFFEVRRSVNKGKALLLTAMENEILQGFVMAIPYKSMVMVDYLAVSSKIRSRGTGSKILQEICRRFPDQKIVLLIEQLDDTAENKDQRIARRKFYFKNGFTSSNIYITGRSGNMEVLNFGGTVSVQEYMGLQQYALGKTMFRLAKIRPVI
ncbi:MAG: GNAT family N-acetyltransferase [Ruthenibacterium sp.]|jgi:GNAT superfamily N-acetyltransferase